jgi:hypothetical protein
MKAALAPPELDIPEFFEPRMTLSLVPHYFVSKQGNQEVTILTESPDLPGFVTLVIYLQAGSRVENEKNAGYAHWLRSSIFNYLSQFPKAFSNTSVEYEREFLVLKSVCMSYQVEEFLGILSKAIGPDALDLNVLENMEVEYDQFYETKEGFLQTSFGGTGLGNMIKGGLNAFQNTDTFIREAHNLHRKVLNSENIVIAASGIFNKEAFYELVVQNFDYLEKANETDSITICNKNNQIKKSEFLGGNGFASISEAVEIPQLENDICYNEPELVVGFKGVQSRDYDYITGLVLKALIGEASMFSVGGPGKNSFARAHNIMEHFFKFDSVNCFHDYYQDM